MKLELCSLFLLLFGVSQIKALRSYGSFMSNVFHIFTDEYEPPPQDENNKPVPEMVRDYGYECEVHEYQTEDGFINVLHRIPPQNPNGRVVFAQHGLEGTSADYVMGRPDKSLGYVLANEGYDVWLGNARGNFYSRKHVNLTTSDAAYWKFSFDQMGKYDLPAAISYVLKETETQKLTYIGHSMGTVMFWVSFDSNAEFMEKSVDVMVAMGPVATVGQIKSPIRILAPFVNKAQWLFDMLGIKQFAPSNALIELFDYYACDYTMRQRKVCENVLFLLTGYDDKQMNKTMLPIILGHEPGGTSVNTVVHFAQEVNSGKFSKFDYGKKQNLIQYGSELPPEYDLKKVTVPVVLMWSENDWLADPEDVQTLIHGLPNIKANIKIPLKEWNHIDFIWGLDAPTMVFKDLLSQIADLRP